MIKLGHPFVKKYLIPEIWDQMAEIMQTIIQYGDQI